MNGIQKVSIEKVPPPIERPNRFANGQGQLPPKCLDLGEPPLRLFGEHPEAHAERVDAHTRQVLTQAIEALTMNGSTTK